MINIPEDKLLEGYCYILSNETGNQSEIAKIHPSLFTYLVNEGCVGRGIDAEGNLRYHITTLGRKIAEIQCRAILLKTIE